MDTYTEPCIGAVGSQPFLDDVQAQLQENNNAQREGREPVILPVKCRFCHQYHKDMQVSGDNVVVNTTDLLTALQDRENNREIIVTDTSPETIKTAIEAVTNQGVADGTSLDVEHPDNVIEDNDQLLANKQAEARRKAIADDNPQSSAVNSNNPSVHVEDGKGNTKPTDAEIEKLIADKPEAKKTTAPAQKANGSK